MLLLGSKGITVEGIQVFPDHADPNQFWYLPGPVQLARDANREAIFTFLKFRPAAVEGGAKGGGWVNFVTNLHMDRHTESRILAKVSALAPGEARLSAVEFDEGTVQCVALNLQGAGGTVAQPGTVMFVQKILGATAPALFGDNEAAFSLTLTQEGATILEQAFQTGTTPVGVIYSLKFTGMRPALDVRITADLKRAYESFSAGLQANVYYVSASVEAGFEKLKQDGTIKIEVTNSTGDAELAQKEQWALDFFRDRLMADWFEPTLQPGQLESGPLFAAPTGGGNPLNALDAATRGNALRPPTPPAPPTPPTGGGPRPPTSPPASPPPASPPASPPPTAASPPPATPPASPPPAPPPAAPGAPATPPAAAGPHPPATPPPAPAATPSSGSGRPAPPAPPPTPPAHPPATPPAPTARTGSPPAPTNRPPNPAGSGLRTNPSSAANAAKPLSNLGSSGTPSVALRLRYVHQDELKSLVFEYHRSEATQRVYSPQGFIGLLASDLDRTVGGRHFQEIDLDDPFFRVFDVTVQAPIDFQRIGLTSVHASLDYGNPAVDPTHLKHQDESFDAQNKQDRHFRVFMDSTLDTSYRYSVEYHFDPLSGWKGKSYEYSIPARSTEDRTLFINPFDVLGFLEVKVFPHRLDKQTILDTDVILTYRAPDGWTQQDRVTVQPDSQPQLWKVRLDDRTATSYTYQFIHHLKDGSTRIMDPVRTSATTVPVDDPFPGAIDLALVPLWDPGKWKAVFVDLQYQDPANNWSWSDELSFTGDAAAPIQRHIPVLDPKRNGFSYRVSLFGKAPGVEQRGPFVETQDTLIGLR